MGCASWLRCEPSAVASSTSHGGDLLQEDEAVIRSLLCSTQPGARLQALHTLARVAYFQTPGTTEAIANSELLPFVTDCLACTSDEVRRSAVVSLANMSRCAPLVGLLAADR